MMTASESERAAGADRNERGLLCARCEYLNRLGAAKCEKCGTDLFVDCPRCGKPTQRVYHRCQHCAKRLHRRLVGTHHHRHHHRRHHRWWRSLRQRYGLSLLSAVLILLGLALAYGLFYLFDQFSF